MLRELAQSPTGWLITFEGGDAAGKSTQLTLAAEWLQQRGFPVLTTREPGGTPFGQSIRSLALNPDTTCCTLAELFLMLADRAQHVADVIQPALSDGFVVLCDRFNDSTVAYQGAAGGLDIHAVRECCSLATSGVQPHLTILLDITPEQALRRISHVRDRMERRPLAFHHTVRQAFLDLAAQEPNRFRVTDAASPEWIVAEHVQRSIGALLGLTGAA